MQQNDDKFEIELKQNQIATRLLWISLILGVICNYFGGSPTSVIIVLLSLGLAVAVFFTVVIVKKVILSYTKYFALVGLIIHAIAITLVHHSLNSIFLLFFNLIFISLFLKASLVICTYISNVIMIICFYLIYGDKMFRGYNNLQGLLIILFYMFLACIILCEMVLLITRLQQETKKQFKKEQENSIFLKSILDQISDSVLFLKNFSNKVMKDMEVAAVSSEEMSTSFNEVAASTEEQFSSTEAIHEYIDKNYKNMELIVKDTDELKQFIFDNNKVIAEGNNTLEQMMKQFEVLSAIINETAGLMVEFNNQNKDIDEILESINAIAKQTNLLSLNANIEAARAGEYGKGFTVVAEEIRKLAESSARSVKMIGEILSELVEKSKEITSKINHGQEVMNLNGRYNANTLQIFKEISRFNEVVMKNTQSVHQMITDLNTNSMVVATQTKEITESTGNISDSISVIVTNAEGQNTMLQNITKNFYELDKHIKSLTDLTNRIQ